MNEVGTICVVGAGQMGRGIAQVAAQSGFKVFLQDFFMILMRNHLKKTLNEVR